MKTLILILALSALYCAEAIRHHKYNSYLQTKTNMPLDMYEDVSLTEFEDNTLMNRAFNLCVDWVLEQSRLTDLKHPHDFMLDEVHGVKRYDYHDGSYEYRFWFDMSNTAGTVFSVDISTNVPSGTTAFIHTSRIDCSPTETDSACKTSRSYMKVAWK